MPISDEVWEARAALYRARQPAIERAKGRYDKRQEMLNDPAARDKYRLQRWGTLGQAYKVSRPTADPIHEITDSAKVIGTLQSTMLPERVEEINKGFDTEYAGYVQEQEVKEFLIRRANIAQATFEQYKMLRPDSTDSEAYNAMHRQLIQYGFQPRGLEKLVPFHLDAGGVSQADYAPVWSEARSLILGTLRGARRMGTAPLELINAGLELVTDIQNRNRAGTEVSDSNLFREARRNFAIEMGAMEQVLSPKDIPYNFDVAGVVGEQIPNMIATVTGTKMIMAGAKLAGNALAMGSMFAMEGTDAYNNYMMFGERQGLDSRLITSQAYAGAMAYGAASAALERLIPVETFRRIPGLKSRVVAWGLGSLAEGTTEFLQSLTQAKIGEVAELGQFDWDSVRAAMREAAAGVIVGGVAGAATIGRATPQVDGLMDTQTPEEIEAQIITELDVVKKRAEIVGEIQPPIQAEEVVETASDAVNRAATETTGLRSQLRAGWRAIIDAPVRIISKIPSENPIGKLRDSIGRGLSDEYKSPEGWETAKREAKGRERRARFQADLMGVQWVKQLKRAGLDPDSPEFLAIAESALRGDIELESLPSAMQAWVKTARTLQDAESLYQAQVCRAAGLDQRADEIERNIGSYLKNIPLAKVDTVARMKSAVRSALGLRVSTAFSKVKRNKWLVWDGTKLLGKFESESEAREIYDTTIAQKKTQLIKKRAVEEGVSAEDLNRQAAKSVKIEAPLTKEWRQKYEVHDPRFLLAASMTEARHDAEMVQMFNTVAQRWGQEAPEGLSESEANDWAKENKLVQLPQSGKLHNLSGIYVPEIIAKDLTDMTRIPNMAERAYGAYLSAWKSSKTLWNPATHARNVYGNVIVFSYLAKCSVLNPLNAKHYRQAMKSLRSKDAAYLALLENGALGAEYYGGEIQRIEQTLKGVEDSKIGQALAGVKVAQKTLGQTYAAEDQIFKLAAYHKYLAEGMSPEVAAEEVNKWFPNYERIGKVTRWLRKSPIGAPFISFVDQSVRIARRGVIERPLRIATLAALPGVMNYISSIAIGLNPDERELIDEERGYFEPLVPWRDEKGRSQVIDLRYIIPLANDIVPEERRGGVMVPWMFSGPAATTAIEQMSGKERFTGKDIIREDMTFLEKAKARGATIARAAIPHPSLTYWGTKRIISSITGDRDEHVANAIVGSIIGLNVRSPYIAEKYIKQIIQNMVSERDWREGKVLLDVWNNRYKPRHLKNLKMESLARGLHQSKISKWRTIRDEAAEAILQGRDEDAQEIVDDYMAELEPGTRPLFMAGVQYRARQFRIEGKTR